MKKLIVLVVFCMIAVSAFAQDSDFPPCKVYTRRAPSRSDGATYRMRATCPADRPYMMGQPATTVIGGYGAVETTMTPDAKSATVVFTLDDVAEQVLDADGNFVFDEKGNQIENPPLYGQPQIQPTCCIK